MSKERIFFSVPSKNIVLSNHVVEESANRVGYVRDAGPRESSLSYRTVRVALGAGANYLGTGESPTPLELNNGNASVSSVGCVWNAWHKVSILSSLNAQR